MTLSTYSDYQSANSSEKVGLVRLEAAKRLTGFSVYSGSVYYLSSFDIEDIVSISDSGVALSSVGSVGAVTAGTYYNDRANNVLYLQTVSSAHPNGRFMSLTFSLFFSNTGVIAPKDLSTGADVQWLPYLDSTSDFIVEVDNQNQLGVAIEGSGSIVLANEINYWKDRFDKLYFENQRCFIYSWNRLLPITEAKLIYRGRVQSKKYDFTKITFNLKDFFNELRAPVDLDTLGEYGGARVSDALLNAKQRRIYGYVFGHKLVSIDQVVDGYPITGTVSVTGGATALTGSGTSFLTQISPDDELYINGSTTSSTVQSITSNTVITLTENYVGLSGSGVTCLIKPRRPSRFHNRIFLVAGHALSNPTTTVTASTSPTFADVASVSGLLPGDAILVNGESTTILRISGLRVVFTTALSAIPAASNVVSRLAISNVYLGDRLLQYSRDYTFSASAGTLTLTSTAEFNVAPTKKISGTATFTSGSRSITGSGTSFKSDLRPGDWIRATAQADYFEISSIESDTALTLKSNSSYSAPSVSAYSRSPDYYDESKSVLSCDVIGLSADGTSTGALLSNGPLIVKDILSRAGLSSAINSASFTSSSALSRERVGFVIPAKLSDTKTPSVRDVVNRINQSAFGSLVQNASFEFEYRVLDPSRQTASLSLDESDILKLAIESRSDRIVKDSVIEYAAREYEPVSMAESFLSVTSTSDVSQYLTGVTKEFRLRTVLVDLSSATIYANRWGFIFSSGSANINFQTKLLAARSSVGDVIQVTHEKLFNRVGATSNIRVAAVQSAKRGVFDSSVQLEDLSGAFSRCSIITSNTASTYSAASDSEKAYNGHITDTYGLMSNDPETANIHLIW